MKSILSLLLVTLAVAFSTTSAFGFGGTPVFQARSVSRQSSRNNLCMRAQVCDLLGKRPNRQARVVSFSHKRHKTVQYVNLHWKKYYSEKLGRKVRMRLSTKGMKTVTKYGSIDAAAEAKGVDISKF